MSAIYYIDGSGTYLGAFDSGLHPSTTPYFTVPYPPARYDMVWNGTSWDQSLSSAKADRLSSLSGYRDAAIATGYTAGGHTYSIDTQSISQINQLAGIAFQVVQGVPGASWDSGQTYPDINGHEVTVADPSVFLTVSRNAILKARAIAKNYNSLFTNITSASTIADVNAIDVSAGWPL